MKTFVSAMVVALMTVALPLCADTVILQENFEGGTPGTALNTLGWTGDGNILISSAVIDSGQSADWSAGSQTWDTRIAKGFSHVPGAGEIYTLTATLYSPTTDGTDAELHIRNAANPSTQMQGVSICYGDMQFGVLNTSDVVKITPQPTSATDVRLVLHGNSSEFSYKAHGASTWISAGGFSDLGWSISAYDEISIQGHGGYAGGIDSVSLTAVPTPEPSSIVMTVIGLLGLLAYAWRKRK